MLTLQNHFHNTEMRTTKTLEELNAIAHTNPADRTQTERAWLNKVRRTLGIKDCTCGCQAPNFVAVDENGLPHDCNLG